MQPKVYIIILNYNGLKDTIECLESLQKITYPNYQVLVIDNSSDGYDVRILREKFGDYCPILKNRYNYGFQKGCNIGMQLSIDEGASYVLLLNNDTSVREDFLDKLVDVAESNPKLGILSSSIYNYYSPKELDPTFSQPLTADWWRNTAKPYEPLWTNNRYFYTEYNVPIASLISTSTIRKIGYLCEDFFLTVGDVDYSIRATRTGIGMAVVRDSVVWHKVGAAMDKGRSKGLNWSRVLEGYIGWQRLRWRYLSKTMYVLTSVGLLGYWGYRLVRRVV